MILANDEHRRGWLRDALPGVGTDRRRDDLVAGLVLSGPHRVDRLYVGGEEIVHGGSLLKADEQEIAREHRKQAARLWR